MKIPSMFYGTAAKVIPGVRKLARLLIEARNFSSYDAGTLLDVSEVQGLVLVNEPIDMAETHFHCYALSQELSKNSPQQQIPQNIHEWLMASLDDEVRFMCTLGGSSWLGLEKYAPEFSRRYVEAAVRHWPAMAAEKHRFGPAVSGLTILDSWTTLFTALEFLGVTSRERMAKPRREPKELLELMERRGALS